MEAQPPEIEQHKKRGPGVSITERDQGSPHQKSLRSRGCNPFSVGKRRER